MVRRTTILAFYIALTAFAAAAAGADEGSGSSDGSVYETWPTSIGYGYHSEGGAGLSWQRWFGPNGLTVTMGGQYDGEADSGSPYEYPLTILDYNAQLRFSRMLYSARFAPWFSNNLQATLFLAHRGVIGVDYDFVIDPAREGEPDYYGDTTVTRRPFAPEYMVGAGVSLEATLFGHFSQTLDFMYVGKWPLELAMAFGWSFRYRY